jgi:D-beta-D-heptose 7-phosphate kinase/D-beta-D-heptose 1-phosphate adenosyltransferase
MRLIIYGEIILDRYFISTTKRKAPEFDIPIYNVNKIEDKLGGASNVAYNLNKYTDILLISVLGNDDISKTIIDILNTNNIKNKIFMSNRKSIVKNRTICNNQIIHRLDYEDTYDIPDNLIEEITLYFENLIIEEKPDDLIISDYNKGIIPYKLCRNLIELCNQYNINTFIDPKVKNIYKYKNSTFIKPNLLEANAFINNNLFDINNESDLGKQFIQFVNNK